MYRESMISYSVHVCRVCNSLSMHQLYVYSYHIKSEFKTKILQSVHFIPSKVSCPSKLGCGSSGSPRNGGGEQEDRTIAKEWLKQL